MTTEENDTGIAKIAFVYAMEHDLSPKVVADFCRLLIHTKIYSMSRAEEDIYRNDPARLAMRQACNEHFFYYSEKTHQIEIVRHLRRAGLR